MLRTLKICTLKYVTAGNSETQTPHSSLKTLKAQKQGNSPLNYIMNNKLLVSCKTSAVVTKNWSIFDSVIMTQTKL